MQFLAVLSLIVVHVLCQVRAELFTSNAHLQTVLYTERAIGRILKDYVEQEESRLEQIKKIADDYETHSTKGLQDLKFLGNPLNAFLMMKRFTADWDRDVKPLISNSTWNDMYQKIQQARENLPSYDDLKGAALALVRLQETYKLSTSALSEGTIAGIKSPVLSLEDCFELGRQVFNSGDYYHTTLWMEQAQKSSTRKAVKKSGVEDKENDVLLESMEYLAYSYFKLEYLPEAVELTNTLRRLDPKNWKFYNNQIHFGGLLNDKHGNKRVFKDFNSRHTYHASMRKKNAEFLKYEALCRGEKTQSLKDRHKFTCRYVTNNHPLLILQPIKEETRHLDPYLVIYYDILNDEEIESIKRLAKPRLNRATVQNPETGALESAKFRISKSAWFRHGEDKVVDRYNLRMQAVTGLDMDTAEDLQIANYGLGGHYEPHYDFARKEEINAFKNLGDTGNRIATVLTYLSDVEAGGATVFPNIGLKLFPKKGAAAFWYNLYRNGDGIYNTLHAACPVLVGSKWVANKWIHERGQEFRHPCGRRADD